MHPQDLRTMARTLPVKPGVYLFRDARDRVLYVGKARRLRHRVLQYAEMRRVDPAKREMVAHARRVETIVTTTEPEALALEAVLVHDHAPPYNVRLVDDSSYLYVKITNEPYPKVTLTRKVLPDGAWYRGPFPSARSIRTTLREARKFFPWCAYPNPGTAHDRPCFATHLGLCPGICIRAVSLEAYQKNIEELKRFLDGDREDALRVLRERMEGFSRAQAYEQAAHIRNALRALEQTMTAQNVVTPRAESLDALGLARQGTHAAAVVLRVRHGRVSGTDVFPLLHPPDEPSATILRGFLLQYYRSGSQGVPKILLPEPIEEMRTVAEWIGARERRRVELHVAERGWRRHLLTIASTNAEEALARSLTELTSPAMIEKALADLATVLRLPSPPARIEAYDISNIQGVLATGAMIVFTNGKPTPAQYRKFKIASEGPPNDVAMMKEVLQRRFGRHAQTAPAARGETKAELAPPTLQGSRRGPRRSTPDEWPLPDLILVDGGTPQLHAAETVLKDLGVRRPLAALAKPHFPPLHAGVSRGGREEAGTDKIYTPERTTPIRLPHTSPSLFLLQRVRDEAHRFTLGYHRLLRGKRMTHSLLEEIPGVGSETRKKLLRAFGSLNAIAAASPEALTAVVGQKLAQRIHAFLTSRK